MWTHEIVPILGILAVFGIPIIAILTGHQQKMAQLRAQSQQGADKKVLDELQALRQQMAELRDTSTRYDMSFDAALQRIESRVGNLEGRVSSIEQNRDTANPTRLG
jgi:aspartate carbamoyltransferase catalytic subunit